MQYPSTDADRGSMLSDEQRAAVASRCVFLRCDEAGAYACADGFRCDVANAPTTTTGCAGIPCGELGRCSTDEYICEPTSAGPHPPSRDPHGCLKKNCEEGAPCPDRYSCNVERAAAGSDGCVITLCSDPGGACTSDVQKCAPATQPELLPSGLTYEPDPFGCVYKRCDIDDFACDAGAACDRSSPLADLHGCARQPNGDAGVGGTAGTGGTAGEAGTTGDPGTPGVCR